MSDDEENMLDELLDCESGLTEWEVEFIDSLDCKRQRPLTQKQSDKLLDIWERVKQ